VIDYETYCNITKLHQEKLKPTQIARQLSLDLRTVRHWIRTGTYQPRKVPVRSSKLDPYKPDIVRWLDGHPYTGVQILQRLREAGYEHTAGRSARDFMGQAHLQKIEAGQTNILITTAHRLQKSLMCRWDDLMTL